MNEQKKALEKIGHEVIEKLKKKKQPEIEIPIRALSNVKFNEKSKTLELGEKTSQRQFFNVGHTKKFLQTLEMASVSKDLLDVDKHASLRDAFYMVKRTIPNTNINIVDDQTESDAALEDLELVTGFSREQLHINANKMGSVAGKVVIEDKGDTIDWSKLGSGGWSIPSNVEEIKFKKVDAQYVIYMEKAAVWERLHEDKFWEKHKCIIMCSQGQSTRGVRRLLQRLANEFDLQIYVLADNDVWGYYIYSVLKYGSISLAHMSEEHAIKNAKFLGITTGDIVKYNLQKHFIKLNEKDLSRLKQLSEYDWFKNNKAWQNEFRVMKQNGAKAEIQALSSRGITFISDKYLPEKIKNKDWLE